MLRSTVVVVAAIEAVLLLAASEVGELTCTVTVVCDGLEGASEVVAASVIVLELEDDAGLDG